MSVSGPNTHDGHLRLYDASGKYVELLFMNADFTGPLGRDTGEEVLHINRGRIDQYMFYTAGSDATIITNNPTLSFSFVVTFFEPNLLKFRQAMNIDRPAVWTVGVDTWVTTKGTTQLLSSSGSLFTTPSFVNVRRRCVNVEVMWLDELGEDDTGQKWPEVEFIPSQQTINEGENEVTIRATGTVYGQPSRITAFSAGAAS